MASWWHLQQNPHSHLNGWIWKFDSCNAIHECLLSKLKQAKMVMLSEVRKTRSIFRVLSISVSRSILSVLLAVEFSLPFSYFCTYRHKHFSDYVLCHSKLLDHTCYAEARVDLFVASSSSREGEEMKWEGGRLYYYPLLYKLHRTRGKSVRIEEQKRSSHTASHHIL